MKTVIKMFTLCNLIFLASCTKDSPVIDGGISIEKNHPETEYEALDVNTLSQEGVMAEIEKARNNPPSSDGFVEDEGELVFVTWMGSGFIAHSGGQGPNPSFYTYAEFNVDGVLGEGRVTMEHQQRIRSGFKGRTKIDMGSAQLMLRDAPGNFYNGQTTIVGGNGALKTAHGVLQRYIYDGNFSGDNRGLSYRASKSIALFGWIVINSDTKPDLT